MLRLLALAFFVLCFVPACGDDSSSDMNVSMDQGVSDGGND